MADDRPMSPSDAPAPIVRLPTPFQISRYITGSDHHHLGVFESPDDDPVETRLRLMRFLLAEFADPTRGVLDLGCGLRDEIAEFFRPHVPAMEDQYHTCANLGRAAHEWYRAGRLGHELFAFDRDAGPTDAG